MCYCCLSKHGFHQLLPDLEIALWIPCFNKKLIYLDGLLDFINVNLKTDIYFMWAKPGAWVVEVFCSWCWSQDWSASWLHKYILDCFLLFFYYWWMIVRKTKSIFHRMKTCLYMYMTLFFHCFRLSCIGSDEYSILYQASCFCFSVFTKVFLVTRWQLPVAVAFRAFDRVTSTSTLVTDGGRCLCHQIGCHSPRVLLLGANYSVEVISLSPTLLVWYVWLLQMGSVVCSQQMQGIG
jgi:hypothetical protein